jgi:hypothetical protein
MQNFRPQDHSLLGEKLPQYRREEQEEEKNADNSGHSACNAQG